jgi:hypothetical protein
MTWTDKPHRQRYTGRGLGWAKKPVTKRQAQRIARWRAGLIVESALSAGWFPEDLVERYGEEGVAMISDEMADVARRIRASGDPDGLPRQ